MHSLEFRLINDYQRHFPLVPRPFRFLAEQSFVAEAEVMARYRCLLERGIVSRIGPVFAPGRIGVSTLLALAVPLNRMAAVAKTLDALEAINHSYEREHELNLWAVATAANAAELTAIVSRIESETGLPVLSLPMTEEFRIDLGFDLRDDAKALSAPVLNGPRVVLGPRSQRLVRRLQSGIEVVPEPYRQLAAQTQMSEDAVLSHLADWIASGVIRRFGVVVHHRELGYRANAMAVWDVPDDVVSELGRRLARTPGVTLAYRRARSLPRWRYNLFCMVHGKARAGVVANIEQAAHAIGLERFAHAVLFSRRRFKQTGACYVTREAAVAHG